MISVVCIGLTPAYAGSTLDVFGRPSPGGAHPRICGEHPSGRTALKQVRGSPPHMRGARDAAWDAAWGAGLTPAYAGSTWWPVRRSPSGRAHPRICGEHDFESLAQTLPGGSPPHMRGARHPYTECSGLCGLTPAYAGSTAPAPTRSLVGWAHPRICGEHVVVARWISMGWGSPPHMRGARIKNIRKPPCSGLTPAYAGSTMTSSPRTLGRRAHPRICGEHPRSQQNFGGVRGSPPHMRGALEQVKMFNYLRGLTPAYAGSTHGVSKISATPGAHPRICGEHGSIARASSPSMGSPPHMRGALRQLRPRLHLVGLTPAYAGSTSRRYAPPRQPGAHPRICGEHLAMSAPNPGVVGSPPHMRGARRGMNRTYFRAGLTPAYAGST
ncbi:Hypothetical protein PFR_JS9-2_2039 [Propionibacterium freudenreichii]|nr:Hypothetical protein PFR_JS9-1_2041 [Propionibacterium freudenreichii]SCQ70628.1 Hypothetical protein PFR_JS9-2_2039 [Propionibacterium freudenreichii]